MPITFILFFEVIFGIILLTFILFPQIKPPFYLVEYINSVFGIFISIICVFIIFLYTNPILGILSIFAFYFLYLRANEKIARVQQTQENTNLELQEMNKTPNTVDTLEEYIIGIMAPINAPPMNSYYYTQFKPINDPIGLASIL
jgi:c-di-AMP phosphodiesterase-like protein